MKFAHTLLSAWAAAAAAYKQSGRSSSEDGLLRYGKSKKDPTTKRIVSCDPKTEETCYDEWHTKAVSCALISDGGCPCPEGQERCDADLANGCVGECTDLCCDWTYEYACYGSYWDGDINFKACGTYKDGCPCPDGQTECHHGFCSDACCDMSTEQLCHGPDNTSICVPFADGSCPCPDGQERCGADPANHVSGWCAIECCDSNYEECYEYDDGYSKQHTNQYCAAFVDGGCPCPGDQVKCGTDFSANNPGWCADVCCDYYTEETCYNPPSSPSCAPIADGGCPCPAGQERCGAGFGDTGWCADDCCDQNTEETCYNFTGCHSNQYCAAISEGGCPCPDGTERCGADLANNYTGWCDVICCNATTEEACYEYPSNGTINGYCAAIADGGCPCPNGTERCGADLENGNTGWCGGGFCCNATTEETCYDYDANGAYIGFVICSCHD